MAMNLDLLHVPARGDHPKNKSSELRLTPKARKFLDYVASYERSYGTGPTTQELYEALDPMKRRGLAAARIVLERLQDNGYLKFHYLRWRLLKGYE